MLHRLFDAIICPNRIRLTFGKFCAAATAAWAAREAEQEPEQRARWPGRFVHLYSVSTDAGGGEVTLKWGIFHQMGRGQHLCSPSIPHGLSTTRRRDDDSSRVITHPSRKGEFDQARLISNTQEGTKEASRCREN